MYLRVTFINDRRQNKDLNLQARKANAVMQALHHLVVLKWELSGKAKLLVLRMIFVPIFIYGESMIITKRVQPQMQASEIIFF